MILSAVLMIDWLNSTEGGSDDSLSSSDDQIGWIVQREVVMILSAVLMIDWLNSTEGGSDDSLSSSDDRLI